MASRLGYCGLDKRHTPLAGDEVRACWEDGAVAAQDRPPDWLPDAGPEGAPPPPLNLIDVPSRPSAGRRLWVEVEGGSRPLP